MQIENVAKITENAKQRVWPKLRWPFQRSYGRSLTQKAKDLYTFHYGSEKAKGKLPMREPTFLEKLLFKKKDSDSTLLEREELKKRIMTLVGHDSSSNTCEDCGQSTGTTIGETPEPPIVEPPPIPKKVKKPPKKLIDRFPFLARFKPKPTENQKLKKLAKSYKKAKKLLDESAKRKFGHLDPKDIEYCMKWDRDLSKLQGRRGGQFGYYTGEMYGADTMEKMHEAFEYFIYAYGVVIAPQGRANGENLADPLKCTYHSSQPLPLDSFFFQFGEQYFIDFLFHYQFDLFFDQGQKD